MGDADALDDAVRDSAEPPDQPDRNPETPSEPETVRLGERFLWCADIQRDWDTRGQAQAQVDAALSAGLDAREVYDAATDELDRAEALQFAESAELRYRDLLPVLVVANDAVVRPVRPGWDGVDATQAIALERARRAFSATADRALLELMAIVYPAPVDGDLDTAQLSDEEGVPAVQRPEGEDAVLPLVPHGGVVSLNPEAGGARQ